MFKMKYINGSRRLITALHVKIIIIVIKTKTQCLHITDNIPCFVNKSLFELLYFNRQKQSTALYLTAAN